MTAATDAAPRACLLRLGSLLVLLLLLVLALALPWWQRYAQYQAAIDQRSEQLRHYDALIATRAGLEQRLAALRANRDRNVYYIDATNDSLGGVTLQRRIEAFVQKEKISLSSVQVLPPEAQPAATRLGVRLRFNCSVDALWRLLYELESSRKPLLLVPSLTLRVIRHGQRRLGRATQDTGSELIVNMDVYGYIRRGHP